MNGYLFDLGSPDMTPIYPQAPGSKGHLGTSEAAADSVADKAETLRQAVLGILSRGEFTADEVADKLGESVLSIRPRFSELRAAGKIVPTGGTRRNQSGRSAAVWSCKAQEQTQITERILKCRKSLSTRT